MNVARNHLEYLEGATAAARKAPMAQLTGLAAKAILEMQLQRLTNLERQKIEDELKALRTDDFEYKQLKINVLCQ